MSLAHESISRYFLCLSIKSFWLAKKTERASIAQQNGSQLDAEAVNPKTMAVVRLKCPPARKPQTPVRTARGWVTDVRIVDVNLQLHFDVTKGDGGFAS